MGQSKHTNCTGYSGRGQDEAYFIVKVLYRISDFSIAHSIGFIKTYLLSFNTKFCTY